MASLCFQSAHELVTAIQNRIITSTELLEAFQERMDRFNPALNAIVTTDFDAAFKQTVKADKALKKGDLWGPLHGLPITIKDNLEVKGLRCTAGYSGLKNHTSTRSADLVKKLKKAGAVVFGKSNLPMFGDDFQTHNELFGQTNNPWNVDKTPGGSSGGAAAAIAAGLTGLDIGNDIGGSIRHPASFCGIYGHKPTFGIVPQRGLIPPMPKSFNGDYSFPTDILVNGPLARSAQDLAVVMDLITQPELPDRKAWKIRLPESDKKQVKEFKIAVWFNDPACPVDESIVNRIRRVADALDNNGALVKEDHPEIDFEQSFDLFIYLLNGVLSLTAPQSVFEEWTRRESELDTEKGEYQARQQKAAVQRHRTWLFKNAERQMLRQVWSDFFKEYDILLCPTTPVTAFDHDHSSWFKRTIEVNGEKMPYANILGWAGLTNVVYLPSTVAPIGISSRGLPIGVQIVGPYLGDKTTIHFAKLLGNLVGGFTPPPSFLT